MVLLTIGHFMANATIHSNEVIRSNTTWAPGIHIVEGSLKILSGCTLTISNNCHLLIDCDILILNGGTLEINHSTDVSVSGVSSGGSWTPYRFIVNGVMTAIGGNNQIIHFDELNSGYGWGGIYISDSADADNEFKYCYFRNSKKSWNSSYSLSNELECGGAIYNEGYVKIQYCYFNENSASCGGAVCNYGGEILIKWSEFESNEAYDGGALTLAGAQTIRVNLNKFWDNDAENNGGAVYFTDVNRPEFYNNLLYLNHAYRGGAIYMDVAGYPEIFSCTIADNQSSNWGGGVYYTGVTPEFENTILYFNIGGTYMEVYPDPDNNQSHYTHCNISGISFFGSNGNINSDPKFVAHSGGNYDYRISGANYSDCIDMGSSSPSGNTNTDLKGDPRLNSTIDIGAYEYELGATYKKADNKDNFINLNTNTILLCLQFSGKSAKIDLTNFGEGLVFISYCDNSAKKLSKTISINLNYGYNFLNLIDSDLPSGIYTILFSNSQGVKISVKFFLN